MIYGKGHTYEEISAILKDIYYEDLIKMIILNELDGYCVPEPRRQEYMDMVYTEYLETDNEYFNLINVANNVGYIDENWDEDIAGPINTRKVVDKALRCL